MEKKMDQISQLLDAVHSYLNNYVLDRPYLATIFHHKADVGNEEDYHYIELDENPIEVKFLLDKKWCLIQNAIYEVKDGNGVLMSLEDLLRYISYDKEELQKDIDWLVEHGMLVIL